MSTVPSNLIPTRITQLPDAPVASEDSLLLISYQGVSYKIRAGDLLAVAGVPTSRQVIAGTGLTGGGQLTSNVTLSIANGGVGPTQLAVTGVTAGAYGSATQIPILTIDATGRVTAASFATPTISSLNGGAANRIAYQTAPNTTGFITAPTVSDTVLKWNGTSFVWSPAATGAVSSVTASLPISSSGGTTPNISIPVATGSVDGYLSSSDWSTFNNKQEGLTLTTSGTSGPATLVGGILNIPNYNPGSSLITAVTATSPVVSSGGPTPNISMAAASASTNGYLTSADWSTFDSKGSGTVTSVSGTGTVNGLTLTGTVTGSGSLTLGGTLSGINLTSQVTGTLPVSNGGTGATTLTGYVKGSGTSAFTASSTIPNTDITGLGTMSTQNASSVTITGGSINGTTIGAGTPAAGTFTSATLTSGTISATPSAANDIVNKAYADSIATGVNYHPAVQYATAATLTSTSGAYTYNNGTSGIGATITGPVNTPLVIDGTTMTASNVTAGTRVLVKNETGAYVNTTTPSAAFNGVYVVTQIATVSVGWVLTRATDYDTSGAGTNEIDQGDFVYVVNGTANTNTSWIQQTALPITVGTTEITFVQFGTVNVYTAGTGLTLSGSNQFSITNTGVTANTYGSASSVPVLTVNSQGQLTGVTNTNISLTSGSSLLYGNGSGGFSNVTVGSGLSFAGGTLSATGSGGTVTSVSVVSANGFAGTVATATSTPAITISTSVTGLLKGNGTAISAATSGTDYAPATSGSSILYGNGAGGFSNATIGTGLSFTAGSLSLANTTVTAASYGSATQVPTITVDAQGRLTAASNTSIAIAANQVTSGTIAINRGGTAGNSTPTAGAVAYGTGTAYAFTVAGTAGQVLTSNGAAAPTWTTPATGTVTSVAALTLGATGTDLSSTVATGTTTPVITLNVPTASASNRGALSSTDWSTFNGKIGGSGTANYVAKFNGSTTTIGNSVIYDDGTNIGVGTASPAAKLDVAGAVKTTGGVLPRAASNASQTSPWAWSSDSYDQQSITALANALTINADAGSPIDGQKTTFRIKDNGTARALTWTTGATKAFRAIGVTLPTTTVINKTVYIGCIYNSADSRWDVVAVAQEA